MVSGEYPRVLDGLCKLVSLDRRVCDPAWIGMKLRKLLNYSEASGSFMARIPGSNKARAWPSTIAYVAQLVIHRYAILGILTEQGHPRSNNGILAVPPEKSHGAADSRLMRGKRCPECGNKTVIRKDGCDFCTACGSIGACG